MLKQAKILVALFVVLLLTASNLKATLIEINLTAEITGISDPDSLLEGKISVSDIMTGSYTYESTTSDSNPLGTVGDYWHYISPYGISVSAGGFVFQTDPSNVSFLVSVSNNHIPSTEDNYLLGSYNNLLLSNGVEVDHISWQLDDTTGTALSSDVLPTTAPVLLDWDNDWGLRITFGYKGYSAIIADVTSVEVVPEPATVLLLGLGGLALLRNRRA